MYDSIIIGSGPAGLSAALNLKIYNKDFIWFGSKNLSDKVVKAEKIANYPGIPMATGRELFEKFTDHIKEAGLEITEKTVTNVMSMGSSFAVLADNEMFEAKTLILAMGVMNGKELDGEDKFLGRGLSYCATCDGMFYRGKKIAVISNDPKFEHEVEYLADLAEEVIFYPSYKGCGIDRKNVIISDGKPVGVDGEKKVNALLLKDGERVGVDGVFCLRNAIAPSKLMPGLAVEDGHIVVDRSCATNIPGCFACGDCSGRPYQYTKAVGEGNVAAHSLVRYLAENK